MDECPLYSEPELYDLLFPDPRHVVYVGNETRAQRLASSEQFYLDEVRRGGGRVLELACGSGRLTIPIAQAAVEIVALDSSESMLNAARAKAVETGVAPMFVHGDMRTFELPGQFSTIFMAGNSLLHLLTNDALRGCLEHVRRHLLGDGQFVFDVFNPEPHLLSRDYEKRYPVLRVRDPKRGEITIEETTKYDAASQINDVTWYMSSPAAPDVRVIKYRLRVIFPQELELLLSSSGFQLKMRYGEFTREPFQATSPRQVCVCVRS
jgi:SAM-dependent methyltransferase